MHSYPGTQLSAAQRRQSHLVSPVWRLMIAAVLALAVGMSVAPATHAQTCPTSSNLAGQNFHGADLSGCNLSGVNLTGANLSKANLSNANLTNANLTNVNFNGTNLTAATLNGATLSGSNLNSANLTGASAVGANLTGTNLNGAALTGANLSGATGLPASAPVGSISSFSLGTTSIQQGASTTLTAVFSGGTGSVDNGVGAVTSSIPVTVSPSTTTTYTLTVTAPNGAIVTASQTLTVLPPPVTLNGANMSDTWVGGWTSCDCPGIFHLFIVQGSDPSGTILNSGYQQPFPAIQLAAGAQDFTLIGNDNSGSEFQGTPQLTLYFSGGQNITVSTSQPSASTVIGGMQVTVSGFTYIPWQQSGVNRVNDNSDSPDGYWDTVAHFTVTVGP